MNNKVLVNYKPISFVKSFIKAEIYVLIILSIAWLLFYLLSNPQRKQYLENNWWFSIIILICFLLITFIQTFLTSNIYIYSVIYDENHDNILIKWQDYKKIKEIIVSINDVEVEIKPSGKNTPYLEIKINNNGDKIKLNQTIYDGWAKKDMEEFNKQIDDLKTGNSTMIP